MKTKSFLSMLDLSQEDLGRILRVASGWKSSRTKGNPHVLERQSWGMLFHKSSTRTRVSFEVGIRELGGHVVQLDPQSMQMGRGETAEDTAKVLSRYLHGLIVRTYDHGWLEEFAANSEIPIVNALTDLLHPCQIVSDLLTLSERWAEPGQGLLESLQGRKLAFLGDTACNMANSWVLAGALTGMEIRLGGPEGYRPSPEMDLRLEKAGLKRTDQFSADPLEAADGADVVYTDVWVSMGDEAEKEERMRIFRPYQVNENVMNAAGKDALFLHCLPAHEGEEVSAGVYRSPQSIVFDQAENRLHAQKAILDSLVS